MGPRVFLTWKYGSFRPIAHVNGPGIISGILLFSILMSNQETSTAQ